MKFRTMRLMMTNGLAAQAALAIIGVFLIMGCGGGGGGGGGSAGGSGDSIVASFDGGAPVTYSEGPMIQGVSDPAIMSTVMSGFGATDISVLIMMANHSTTDPNDDEMLMITFEGTAAGNYPIDSIMNMVMLMDGPDMYAPPGAAPTGTIVITRYDESRIEGEIVGLTLEEAFTSAVITFECNFSLTPGLDSPAGSIP